MRRRPYEEKEVKLATEKMIEKGIDNLVGALRDPIIVWPGGWGENIPDWLKTSVTLERLVENMKALKGEQPTGTDAEACIYLMSASLSFPFDSDWTQIYLYVATREMQRKNKESPPADIAVESLRDDQMSDLNRLKKWIYEKRIQARHAKRREDKPRGEHHLAPAFRKQEKEKQELEVIQGKFF